MTLYQRRQRLIEAAQTLRCISCGSEQIQLMCFDATTAMWRCRMCKSYWRTEE